MYYVVPAVDDGRRHRRALLPEVSHVLDELHELDGVGGRAMVGPGQVLHLQRGEGCVCDLGSRGRKVSTNFLVDIGFKHDGKRSN